jgi:hypothetical protein
MKLLIICSILIYASLPGSEKVQVKTDKEFKEKISKTIPLKGDLASSVLLLDNINGLVTVEGYSGTEIQFEVEKTLEADDEAWLEKAKKEVELVFEQSGDSVMVYIVTPHTRWFRDKSGYSYRSWHNNWRQDYDYRFDFKIKVPSQVNLDVNTVNSGDLSIKNSTGVVYASNVNGSISLDVKSNKVVARTVNGDITGDFLMVPSKDSMFETLNGDIKLTFPENLSADLEFKNSNGDFYTNYPVVEALPVAVDKTEDRDHGKKVYKVAQYNRVRVGKGGIALRFKSFNGDIYISKK